MARKAQVTRTISATAVNVLLCNKESAEVHNEVVTLARTYKDKKAILKALDKLDQFGDNGTEAIVDIVSTKVVKGLYGMSEDEFVSHAQLILDEDQLKQRNDFIAAKRAAKAEA